MAMMIDDGYYMVPVAPPPPLPPPPLPEPPPPVDYSGNVPAAAQGAPQPTVPAGTTLGDVASGQQGQPFDVTLSQLATEVYNDPSKPISEQPRPGPPEPWERVSNEDLAARGVQDPQAWREQYLGGNNQTTAEHFHAEVYTDGSGDYVLAYRGTDGTGTDWMNNFRQGTGFETGDGVDKFSGMAVDTAIEFERVFGNNGDNSSNLAITGHSQGGGLASVGSLASGVPAVTFDASGVHPNTLDRIGERLNLDLSPENARAIAEGGQIRAYSLQQDLLTQAQEGGPLGLAMPDALGTSIVVDASGVQGATQTGRGLAIETGLPPIVAGGLGWLADRAADSGIPVISQVGGLVGSAVAHSPILLTEAMIQQQPWQPGYQNPDDFGKDLQNLVPDALKDDYSRNVNDLVNDVINVANTDFAEGDYVEGGFSIAGDVLEGVFNSAGDTVQQGSVVVADAVRDNVGGLPGDILAGGIELGGQAVEVIADGAGSVVEFGADVAGDVAQGATDFFNWVTGR